MVEAEILPLQDFLYTHFLDILNFWIRLGGSLRLPRVAADDLWVLKIHTDGSELDLLRGAIGLVEPHLGWVAHPQDHGNGDVFF